MKTAIVCEGGAMRGVYTAGVLQAFMDESFMPDVVVGVSAGASNSASFVAGQRGRGYRTNVDYAKDKRYLSIGNYLRTGSLFGMDYIFGEIPTTLDPFDYEAFQASPIEYYAGVTDINTGKPVFYGKQHLTLGLTLLRASCSMPVFSPVVEYQGNHYLDGGVSAPVPIDKALALGCQRLVVILTRSRDYRKKPQNFRIIYKNLYKQYPQFIRAMEVRHLVYNHALERLARLEKTGQAIVIAPKQPLAVDRFGQDRDKLVAAYQIGFTDGLEALTLL